MKRKTASFPRRHDDEWQRLRQLGDVATATLKEPYVPSEQEVENEALWTRMSEEVDTVKKQELKDLWLEQELAYRMSKVPKKRATQF